MFYVIVRSNVILSDHRFPMQKLVNKNKSILKQTKFKIFFLSFLVFVMENYTVMVDLLNANRSTKEILAGLN
jgi:hypothetical protein